MAKGKDRIDLFHRQREIPREIVKEARMLFQTISHTSKTLFHKPVQLGTQPRKSDGWPDFRIGLISRRVSIAETASDEAELAEFRPPLRLYGTQMPPYYRMGRPLSIPAITAARQRLSEDIRRLVEEESANVVCVNELGYPAFKMPREKGHDKQQCDELKRADSEFRQYLQDLCDKHACIIVCGSYHDVEDLKNKALIFAPQETEAKEHQKLTTAKVASVGEIVRTPPDISLYLYDTIIGRIGVLICSDVVDMNVFFRFALIGQSPNESPPHLILVPSWTQAPLTQACRDLSYFSKSVVAYVNGAGEPHAAVYVAGERVFHRADLGRAVIQITADQRSDLIEAVEKMHQKGIFAGMWGSLTA